MNMDELNVFIYSEEEAFKNYKNQLSTLVKIDEKDHSIIILKPDNKLSKGEKIAIYLIGRYIRYKMGDYKSPDASNREISRDLKIAVNIVNARIKDLTDNKLAWSNTKGRHRISFIKIGELLKKINGEAHNND